MHDELLFSESDGVKGNSNEDGTNGANGTDGGDVNFTGGASQAAFTVAYWRGGNTPCNAMQK